MPSSRVEGPVDQFECAKGKASLSWRSGSLLVTMSGHVDSNVGRRLAASLHTTLEGAAAPVRTFWDLEQLEHYHSDVRVLCTQSLLRNWAKVLCIQTLARSRIVKMGVAVANVALQGRVRNTESRTEFESLLRADGK